MRRLTVITINYNNRSGLARTQASVLAQDFTDFDWLIVDGGSTDGSLSILSRVQFEGIRTISEQDNGIYDAMNKGISKVNTEFVMFLNSGDILAEASVIGKLHEVLNKTEVDIVYGDIKIQSGSNIGRHWRSGDINFIKILFGWHTPHPAMIYSLKCLKKIGGYDEQYTIAADYDIFIRLYKAGYEFIYKDICISVMEKPGASGGSIFQMLKSNLQVLHSWRNTFKFIPFWMLLTKPLYKVTQLRPFKQYTLEYEERK